MIPTIYLWSSVYFIQSPKAQNWLVQGQNMCIFKKSAWKSVEIESIGRLSKISNRLTDLVGARQFNA